MYIRCLFIQRKENYPGEYAPELLAAADEGTLEENPDYFPEQCEKELKAVGDEVASKIVLDIYVDGANIKKLLNPAPPVLKGTIDYENVKELNPERS